jgi:hypothetical protein
MKFFAARGGLTKDDVRDLISLAQDEARGWYDMGILPPSSGNSGVLCSERVSLRPCVECVVRRLHFVRVRAASGRGMRSTKGTNFSPHPPPLPPTHLHRDAAHDTYR